MAGSTKVVAANNGPPSRISATRALKNAHHLQSVAPQIMPKIEPPEGFGSVIPLKILAQLHRHAGHVIQGLDAHLATQLKNVVFPTMSNASGDPLFNGTLHFVRISFTVQSQGNAVIAVSAADVATAVEYATEAAPAISAYAGQYGANTIVVPQPVLTFAVTLAGPTYNDAQLQSWVNSIASTNGLTKDACIIVSNPQNLSNTSADRAAGYGGYHGNANVPYIFVNLFGQNLTVADESFAYAQILSHEMAEMVVDPLVDGKNPEVCDGCGPNCQAVYLVYFGDSGYLQTTPRSLATQFFLRLLYQCHRKACIDNRVSGATQCLRLSATALASRPN